MKIATSILSVPDHLNECLEKLNQTDTDYIHLDVMDGKFVSHKTNDYVPLKNQFLKPLDIHFMVEDVPTYFEHYMALKPEYMTFHVEVSTKIEKLIHMIHEKNIKVGISLKPDTPVSFLIPYLDEVDLVLVMSVEPGAGGQTFLDSASEKIRFLDRIRKERDYHYVIEVDGGINETTKQQCIGADILVSGSFITNHDDYQHQIDMLR